MEVRSDLYGAVTRIAHLERRHRTVGIECDRRRTAHVTADRHILCRRVDICGNSGAHFWSSHVGLLLCLHWIGVCTVTRRLPSVNTASICTIGTSSATPSITSALVRTVRASLVTSSIVFPARAPSRATDEMTATASGELSLRPLARRFNATSAIM